MIMKRVYILAFFTALAAVGCVNNTPTQMRTAVEIAFSPAVVPATRADGAVYSEQSTFGVWLYSLPYIYAWEDHAADATLIIDGDEVVCNGGTWKTVAAYSWLSDCTVTLFGWSPYTLDAKFSLERGISFENFDITASDVRPMFAQGVTDRVQTLDGVLPVPFVNSLAKVEFRAATTVNTNVEMRVKSISVGDIACCGNFYSLPTPCWELFDKQITIEFCQEPVALSHSSKSLGVAQWVVPQAVNQPVVVTYDMYTADGRLLYADQIMQSEPIANTWRVGKHYIYTLTMSHKEVTFNTQILDNL